MGGGKYSEVCLSAIHKSSINSSSAQVFKGTDILNDETCVIKVLKPVSEKKIKREVSRSRVVVERKFLSVWS